MHGPRQLASGQTVAGPTIALSIHPGQRPIAVFSVVSRTGARWPGQVSSACPAAEDAVQQRHDPCDNWVASSSSLKPLRHTRHPLRSLTDRSVGVTVRPDLREEPPIIAEKIGIMETG